MNNSLLLKVSALEHVSSNEVCRIVQDVITIICNPPGQAQPNPTPTPTPTATPIPSLSTSLIVAGLSTSNSSISGYGITFASSGGSLLSFNTQTDSATISTLSIKISSLEVARIVFLDSYLNQSFKFTYNSMSYYGTFTNGVINF
jgi:hypothetical protein